MRKFQNEVEIKSHLKKLNAESLRLKGMYTDDPSEILGNEERLEEIAVERKKVLLYLKERQEKSKADRHERAEAKLVERDLALKKMIPLLTEWVKKMSALNKLAEEFEEIQELSQKAYSANIYCDRAGLPNLNLFLLAPQANSTRLKNALAVSFGPELFGLHKANLQNFNLSNDTVKAIEVLESSQEESK